MFMNYDFDRMKYECKCKQNMSISKLNNASGICNTVAHAGINIKT